MLIQRHHVDAAFLDPRQTGFAIDCMLHGKALPLEPALNQPCESRIVVNVEKER